MAQIIHLTDGFEAIVSDEDYERCLLLVWVKTLAGYASGTPKLVSRGQPIPLHRFIMGCPYGDKSIVDHINRNRLDNRRENLRMATAQQNSWNRHDTYHGMLGVNRIRLTGGTYRYIASITINGERVVLGEFDQESEAIRVRVDACNAHYGEFSPYRNGFTPEPRSQWKRKTIRRIT